MVEVLVIPDGAADDPTHGPTSLEQADMPTLDELCRQGLVESVQTIPLGMRPGSEVGIPILLGADLQQPPSRGLIEAAAAGVKVPAGMQAWRVDAPRSLENDAHLLREGARYGLIPLRGHRWLAVGLSAPPLPQPWVVWPSGANLSRVLHSSTTVIAARGAAAGCAILLGAHVIVPRGATGDTDTDYQAKVKAVLNMLDSASRVVVHFGATDEASHRGDRDAKVRTLELIDELVLRPLMSAVGERGGLLRVCPDHGTDVTSGEHLSSPVPALSWGPSIRPSGPDHLWERVLFGAVGA